MGKHTRYRREFKRKVVLMMKTAPNIPKLARELGLYKNYLYEWRREFAGQEEEASGSEKRVRRPGHRRTAAGSDQPDTFARTGPPLRSRSAVCAREYMALLKQHQMIPSVSRPANPYDNAFCESFMKTLKREEIYCHQYRNLTELTHHVPRNSWTSTTTISGCIAPWVIARRRSSSVTARQPPRRPPE